MGLSSSVSRAAQRFLGHRGPRGQGPHRRPSGGERRESTGEPHSEIPAFTLVDQIVTDPPPPPPTEAPIPARGSPPRRGAEPIRRVPSPFDVYGHCMLKRCAYFKQAWAAGDVTGPPK